MGSPRPSWGPFPCPWGCPLQAHPTVALPCPGMLVLCLLMFASCDPEDAPQGCATLPTVSLAWQRPQEAREEFSFELSAEIPAGPCRTIPPCPYSISGRSSVSKCPSHHPLSLLHTSLGLSSGTDDPFWINSPCSSFSFP